jgi:hypothetical protein
MRMSKLSNVIAIEAFTEHVPKLGHITIRREAEGHCQSSLALSVPSSRFPVVLLLSIVLLPSPGCIDD